MSICLLLLVLTALLQPGYTLICETFVNCSCKGTIDKLEIDCSDRGFDRFPQDIPSNVHSINLSKNSFQKLPKILGLYSHLEHLNLSYNQLDHFDYESVRLLPTLRSIDLSNNRIKTREIRNRPNITGTNLHWVNISGNVPKRTWINDNDLIQYKSYPKKFSLRNSGISAKTIHVITKRQQEFPDELMKLLPKQLPESVKKELIRNYEVQKRKQYQEAYQRIQPGYDRIKYYPNKSENDIKMIAGVIASALALIIKLTCRMCCCTSSDDENTTLIPEE